MTEALDRSTLWLQEKACSAIAIEAMGRKGASCLWTLGNP